MFTLKTSFKPLLLGGGGGLKSVSRGDCEQQGGKLLRLLPQSRPRIRPLYEAALHFAETTGIYQMSTLGPRYTRMYLHAYAKLKRVYVQQKYRTAQSRYKQQHGYGQRWSKSKVNGRLTAYTAKNHRNFNVTKEIFIFQKCLLLCLMCITATGVLQYEKKHLERFVKS